ncbi:MAG: redoxin domain-containing protein [Planctomycetes bacterium]|nr:redoxin domain-containing protein [Planctomycetota bacterium]
MICRAELQGLGDELAGRGIAAPAVLAIAPDAPEDLKAFGEQLGPAIALFSDADRRVIRAFDLLHPGAQPGGGDTARPATFVISGGGEILFAHAAESVLDRPDPADTADVYEKAVGPAGLRR